LPGNFDEGAKKFRRDGRKFWNSKVEALFKNPQTLFISSTGHGKMRRSYVAQ
jgi:hypothetical protein